MGGKINGWQNLYISGKGVHTAISRIIRGDPAALAAELSGRKWRPMRSAG